MEIKHMNLDQLKAEREHLESVRNELQRRTEVVEQQRVAMNGQADKIRLFNTPEGLLGITDKQLASEEAKFRDLQREYARASADLKRYEETARGVARKLSEVRQAEFELRHAEERAVFFAKVREYLALGAKMAAVEAELRGLSMAAGYNRPPVPLFVAQGPTRTPWDEVRYDLGTYSRDLLAPDDPQRIRLERESGVPLVA